MGIMEFGEVKTQPEGEQEVKRKRLGKQYQNAFMHGQLNEGFRQRLPMTYLLFFKVVITKIRQEDRAHVLLAGAHG